MYLGGTSKKGFRFFAPCLGLAAINNIYKKKMDYYIIFRTKFFFYLENTLYICPISSGGGTNQDVCRPTRPQTLSSRPI